MEVGRENEPSLLVTKPVWKLVHELQLIFEIPLFPTENLNQHFLESTSSLIPKNFGEKNCIK